MSETQDSDYEPTEFEEKMDELNEGLLRAYAEGYSDALDDHDVELEDDTSPSALMDNSYIQESSYYVWDGRSKPLEHWLEDTLGEDGDADE